MFFIARIKIKPNLSNIMNEKNEDFAQILFKIIVLGDCGTIS